MADLLIREKDGWKEITQMVDRTRLDFDGLWKAVAIRDWKEAESQLWEALYRDDEEAYAMMIGPGSKGYPEVAMLAFPDDMHGDFHRIWIRMP